MTSQQIIDLAREIVATLVHLKESPQGVPEHGAPGYASIRQVYAQTHAAERSGDPLIAAAEKWVAEKLHGLHSEPAPVPPVPAQEVTIQHGGVAVIDAPITDAELEQAAAPAPEK
jgi:hypothetical protein